MTAGSSIQRGLRSALWGSLLAVLGCTHAFSKPDDSPITAAECAKTPGIPTSYRQTNYRAPTPRCTPYATTLTANQLYELLQQKSPAKIALIDVLGVTRRPEMDDFDSAWLPSRARYNLAGSHWLPNVGYASLDKEMASYFKSNLARITKDNKQHPIVIYCIVDCWLSWNAIKRAHDLGYTDLYWFPDGTDGWEEYGYALAPSTPIPIYQ